MFPLGLLSPGERGQIAAIREPAATAAQCLGKSDCRVEDLGLRVGKVIEMLNNASGGPILLKVDESRIAIARALAMKIMVTRPG